MCDPSGLWGVGCHTPGLAMDLSIVAAVVVVVFDDE